MDLLDDGITRFDLIPLLLLRVMASIVFVIISYEVGSYLWGLIRKWGSNRGYTALILKNNLPMFPVIRQMRENHKISGFGFIRRLIPVYYAVFEYEFTNACHFFGTSKKQEGKESSL